MTSPPLPASAHTAIAAVALLTLAACQMPQIGGPCSAFSESGGAGDACGEQFYYPTGLAIDPSGETLYVSNGNADLRYAGGTVQTVDLGRFECMVDYTRDGTRGAGCDPYLFCAMDYARSGFRTIPSGCDANRLKNDFSTANQKRLGKKALCRPDLLDTQITECDEQLIISSAARVGNFAGDVVLQERSSGARLWVAVRGDPSVTFIDLNSSDHALSCDGTAGTTSEPVSCANQRVTVRDFHDGEPGAQCQTDHSTCVMMPPEPFGLKLDQGTRPALWTCPDGTSCASGSTCTDGTACPAGQSYARLLVSYLANGEVALIDASVDDPTSTREHQPTQPVVLDVKGGFFAADVNGRRGAFALAPRIPGDPRSYWYVTSRVNPTVALFRISDSNLILPAGKVTLSGPYYSGSDVRGLVFDPCTDDDPGCRAFIVDNDPPSVFTLDTRIDPVVGTPGSPAGLPEDQVASIVAACQGPAHLAFRRIDLGSGFSASRLYAVCFDGNQIAVIDPDQERVVGNTLVGRGPSSIVFNFGPEVTAQPQHLRAYVTDYLDMNIAVIDLDPGSPTENHVIARIGLTEPPGKQQ